MRWPTIAVLVAVCAAGVAGYLSRDRATVAAAEPDQPGYSELGDCSATTSFDDRSVMGLHSDGYAEVTGDAGTKVGRWSFKDGHYRVTLGGETAAYRRVEVEPVACILIKGEAHAADLLGSWFARAPQPRTLGPDD